jgi:hypothetical protein
MAERGGMSCKRRASGSSGLEYGFRALGSAEPRNDSVACAPHPPGGRVMEKRVSGVATK